MEFLMRAVGAIVLAVWLTSLFSQPALAEKRVALVMGNSAYQSVNRLTNPANDSGAMSETLKNAGFDVVEFRRDLKVNEMRRALRDFSDRVSDADVAVVYYAGHGMEIDGINYVIPVDAVLERDIDAYDEAVSLDRILAVIEPAKALRLVILDACRDNPFNKTMKRTIGSRAIGRGLAKIEPNSPNTLIAFAAKAGSTASDGDSKNSPFTTALVKYLPKPGLDLRRAFGFARDDVLKATNNRQEPFVYGSLGGDDVALVPAKPVGPTAAQNWGPNPQADMRRDYELALQLGTRAAWASFLNAHPSGFYADLARGQLEKAQATAANAVPNKSVNMSSTAANPENEKSAQEVASLTPADPAAPKAESVVGINRLLQIELRRVGCYSGSVDGNWNAAAQKSLGLFNKNANMKLDVKKPEIEALDALKSKAARVCPLTCNHGYEVDGESCTKITCSSGYEVGDDNTCEKITSKRPAAKRETPLPAKPKRTAQEPVAKPQKNGEMFCDQGGCRTIEKSCRIVSGNPAKPWSANSTVVCN
jgi:hypothetical protein